MNEKDPTEVTVTETNPKDPFHMEGTRTFGISAEFPVEMNDPQCCTKYGARIFLDTDELQAWIEYRHEETCEIWRFLP